MAQQITALPTPPSRTSPGTFSERTDAFLGALPGFVTEANALAIEAETHGTAAVASAASAAADAATATEQATLAVNATALLEPGYISNAAYDEAAWALITNAAASKKAVRDKIEAILTLVGNKQASDATLTALAGLSTAADKLAYFTGNDTANVTTLTAFARTLLAAADAATMRTTLGAQASATAITTSNIASQSVSYAGSAGTCTGNSATATYASSAGNADTLDGYHAASLIKWTDTWQSLEDNGYIRLPGGLIIQWGYVSTTGVNLTLTWPIALSTAVVSIQGTPVYSAGQGNIVTPEFFTYTTTNTKYDATTPFTWLAIGY